MRNLGREDQYTWDRPAPILPRVNFTSYKAAKFILEHAKEFNVVWTEPYGFLMGKGGLDFMLSGDTPFHTKQRKLMGEALYRDKWHQQIKDFYEYTTLKLLTEKSCKIAGINQVDITREYASHSLFFCTFADYNQCRKPGPRPLCCERVLPSSEDRRPSSRNLFRTRNVHGPCGPLHLHLLRPRSSEIIPSATGCPSRYSATGEARRG